MGLLGWVKAIKVTGQTKLKKKATDSMTSLKELRSTFILYVKRGDLEKKQIVHSWASFSFSASLELIQLLDGT